MPEHKIKLRPFQVPVFALAEVLPGKREDGFTRVPGMALSEIEADTLSKMCRDFRAAVFAKAGKVDPDEERTVLKARVAELEAERDHLYQLGDTLSLSHPLSSGKSAWNNDPIVHRIYLEKGGK